MKKSMLAIAIAASTAFASVVAPNAIAQETASAWEGREIGQAFPYGNGNLTEGCDATLVAGAIIDPSIPDWSNQGFTTKVKSPHQTAGQPSFSGPGSMEFQHYVTGQARNGTLGLYLRLPVGVDYEMNNAKLTIDLPEIEGATYEVRPSGAPFYPVRDYASLSPMPEGVMNGNTVTYDVGTMPAGSGFTASVVAKFEGASSPAEVTERVKAAIEGNPNVFKVDGTLEGDFADSTYMSCDGVNYDDSFTTPGQNVKVNPNREGVLPEGTEFSVSSVVRDSDGNEVSGWTVEINPTTGELTATPPEDALQDVYTVTVTLTTEDGFSFTTEPRIHVDRDTEVTMEPGYQDAEGEFHPGTGGEGTVPGHIVTITKGDGTIEEYFIPNGQDGEDGEDGQTPIIGENGNWFIGGEDTGVKATCDCEPGKDGEDGKSISIINTGTYSNGNIWVEFSDGTTIEIPAGKDGKDGKDAEPNPGDYGGDTPGSSTGSSANPRCMAAGLSAGLPLLLLLPVGVASQVDIPGMSQLQGQLNSAFADVNRDIQKGLGIFDENQAGAAGAVNAQLAEISRVGGQVAGGVAAVAAGALLITYLVHNCMPVAEGQEPGALALPENLLSS